MYGFFLFISISIIALIFLYRIAWSNMKLTNELEHRRQLDQMNFERAAQGAIMKTYKYDPTRTRPVEKAKV